MSPIGPIRILVISTEAETRLTFEHALSGQRVAIEGRSHECELIPLATGAEALREIENGWFDVIAVSFDLGEWSGLDLLSSVRALGKEIPVILLKETSDQDGSKSGDAARALRLGCFDFMMGPMTVEKVRSAVHRAAQFGLRGRELEVQIAKHLSLCVGRLQKQSIAATADRLNQLRVVFRSMILASQNQPECLPAGRVVSPSISELLKPESGSAKSRTKAKHARSKPRRAA